MRPLARFSRLALGTVFGLAVLGLAAVLTIKHVILPNIDAQRARIEAIASAAVGVPVHIGAIEAAWPGLNPQLTLREVRLGVPGEPAGLALPQVEGRLSWTSLLSLEPRFETLVLQRPQLTVRRDAEGRLFVAGLAIGGEKTASAFPDWLLRQAHIQVRDAELVWLDERLGAPPLRLTGLRLSLFNRFGRHRFGLVATPPAELARHLDIRGDFRGKTLSRPQDWRGRLYARLDATELSAWNRWAPWAQPAVAGHACCMRFWAELEAGRILHLTGDVKLRDVHVRLDEPALADLVPDAPFDLAFAELSGRLGWHQLEGAHEIRVEGLRLRTVTGHDSAAASARAVIAPLPNGGWRLTRAEAKGLRLEALIALADAVPLPRAIREGLFALNPRGQVDEAEIEWLGPERYRIAARFQDLGFDAWQGLPGIGGLSGEVRGDPDGGLATLHGPLHFDLPSVLRQPLAFDAFDGRLSWKAAEAGGHVLEIERLELRNADLSGRLGGRLHLRKGQAPVAALTGQLDRALASAVWKYLPHKVGQHAYDWLKRSLIGGHSDDVRLSLNGPLDRFPFDKGGGDFSVQVRVRAGQLDYAPRWPGIRDIEGWLVFHGMAMTMNVSSARLLGAELRQVRAHIPDLHYTWDETLFVDGVALGPTAAFLEFIQKSPVLDYSGRFTERLKAEGQGRLELKLTMPVRMVDKTTVAGTYRFLDNRIDPGPGLPVLDKVSGELRFTETRVEAPRLSAQILNRPVEIRLTSRPGGRVQAQLTGRLAVADLGQHLPAILRRHVLGETTYRADLLIQGGGVQARIESDLVGLVSQLPPPLAKAATVATPASLELGPDGRVGLRYGDLLSGQLELAGGALKRAVLGLGSGRFALPESGLAVRGSLPYLDLDAWRAFWGQQPAATGEDGLALKEIDTAFAEVRVAGRHFRDLAIQAQPNGAAWNVRLNGRELRGEVDYRPPAGDALGQLNGRFKRLELPEARGGGGTGNDPRLDTVLDIQAESFVWRGRDRGALKFRLLPNAPRWRLEGFSLGTADGRLEANGELASAAPDRSRLEVRLKAGNLGRMLERYGLGEGLKRGEAEASGRLHWPGGLTQFELGSLGGEVGLRARNGQFTKIEPGAGRLLGVLSLQALPRRITLDFRDVFSEGFAFDEVNGSAQLERGIAQIKDMRMSGPSARIALNGKIDLAQETQALRITVQPRLDESVALGAALLGGPAVGVGALVAGKLLKDPVGQAVAFEYQISGTWDDPVVVKLGRNRETPEPETQR